VTLGQVEIAVIEFRGNRFGGEIVPALAEVVDRGIVRIVDLVFVVKDAVGTVRGIELEALGGDVGQEMLPLMDDVMGLLSDDDVQQVGDVLPPNSSAALIVFEHTWASGLRQAIANADGRIVAQERVPAEVVQRALAARHAAPE